MSEEPVSGASEEQYRLIAESIPHPAWVSRPDGTAEYLNSQYREYAGASLPDVLDAGWQRLIHPDDLLTTLQAWSHSLHTGTPYYCEHRLRRADGIYRWHSKRAMPLRNGQGHIARWLGTGIDIEQQKHAEEGRRLIEGRFRAIIEKSFDAVILLGADGTLLYATPSYSRVLGYTPEELVGRDAFDLVHPEDRPRIAQLFAGLIGRPGGSEGAVHRALHQDGSWRWLETRGTNLLDDTAVGAVVINFCDISERRRLEEQLRQSQKLEAIGQLASGVAHDFNNLLTVINGYSEIVYDALGPDNPVSNLVDEIRKAGERSTSLTRQLLAFSRKQVIVPTVLNLNRVVTDLGKMLRRVIGEDIDLATSLAPSLENINADPGQIEQVLLNLVVNARDAMPQGGKLTIETRNVNLDARTGSELRPGPYVLLAVRDTGCGMTPEVQARIFEPFFTTKGPGKGTGLGLATVFGIVKQSGGHIEVHSELGIGTTFKVYLPVVEGTASTRKSWSGLAPAARGNEIIVLVEDEESVRVVTRQILQNNGYTVLTAADGEEALRLCRERRERIDLLVSDVVMPGLGGRELSERLLTLHPEMKVLFLSGYTDDAVVRHGILQEEVNFLQKPFSPLALVQKVREVLDSPVAPATVVE
jgi:PAS domain S-box-containing protein